MPTKSAKKKSVAKKKPVAKKKSVAKKPVAKKKAVAKSKPGAAHAAAKKKAEQMENELRNFVIGQHGMNAWQEIIRIQGELRKKQKEAEILAAQKRDELIYNLCMLGLIVLFISLILPILWVVIQNV